MLPFMWYIYSSHSSNDFPLLCLSVLESNHTIMTSSLETSLSVAPAAVYCDDTD